MSEGKRARLSSAHRTEIWSRWKSGQSLHEIGRAYVKRHSAPRRRFRLALALAEHPDYEREQVLNRFANGSSMISRKRTLEGCLLGIHHPIPDSFRHGAMIPAFVSIWDQFGAEYRRPVLLRANRAANVHPQLAGAEKEPNGPQGCSARNNELCRDQAGVCVRLCQAGLICR